MKVFFKEQLISINLQKHENKICSNKYFNNPKCKVKIFENNIKNIEAKWIITI